MKTKFSILKCYRYFDILYFHSSFNKNTRKSFSYDAVYKKQMFHHSTDKYLVFWNGKEYVKFLKTNIKQIIESDGGNS